MSDAILQHTQRIGWREEAADGTDPITSISLTFYEFGIYTTTWGKYPVLQSELKQYYRGLQFNAYQQRVASTVVVGSISYIPVNGLMFYRLMAINGAGVTHAAGVYRINGITSGFLNTYTTRFRSDNDQDRIQRSCIGTKYQSLTFSINFDEQLDPMAMSEVLTARRMDAIQSSSLAALPSQPANSNPFYIDTNTKLLWDCDIDANGQYVNTGTDLDLIPYMIHLTATIDVQMKPSKVVTVHYQTFLLNGPRIYSIQMKLRRTDETSIFDHYVGTTVDGTVVNDDSQAGKSYAGLSTAFKNMHFKIFAKNAAGAVSNYIQMDWQTIGITRIEMNDADPEQDEESWYDITMIAIAGVPTTKDEVAAALYGTT